MARPMTTDAPHTLALVLAPALLALALAGCGSSPSAVMGETDGGSDAGSDAGDDGGAVVRKATTRALLPTAVTNLLLDPFVTSDTSLGHFVGVLLPAAAANYVEFTPVRSFVSQAPVGVAGPIAVLAPITTYGEPSATSAQILAPFPGGTASFDAQIWVSAGDAAGMPVPFATGGKGFAVSLLPNDTSLPAYPLAVSGTPVELAGREWVLFALATPVAVVQGGWFSIVVDDVKASFQVQAPQVTPAGAMGGSPRTTPRTERDRVALEAYTALTHRRRRPRR
jgi:hypothetical protein